MAKAVAEEFDAFIPGYYSDADKARGYITTLDRQNKTKDFPLMSLTLAIVAPKTPLQHYAQIVQSAAELKKYAKDLAQRKGSFWVKDRRI